MGRKRSETCSKVRCNAPNLKYGLCEEHYTEYEERQRLDSRALAVLEYKQRPEYPCSPEGEHLAAEVSWVRDVWSNYCSCVNFPPGRLLSSVECTAQDVCLGYTARLVQQVDELNSGAPLSEALITRERGVQRLLSSWDK